MSDLTNLKKFKIGDKDFSFKLRRKPRNKKKILSIINQGQILHKGRRKHIQRKNFFNRRQ